MINCWFLCKVTSEQVDDKGMAKRVAEQYLIDAVSFTDAEIRISEMMKQFHNTFFIANVARTKITDVFFYKDAEKWFRCKVRYNSVDEESGKEKLINNLMLVLALNAKQAYERIEEKLSDMMIDYEIPEITLTQILDVFPYIADEQPKSLEEVLQRMPASTPNADNVPFDYDEETDEDASIREEV